MTITGFFLFLVLILVAVFLGRRDRAGLAIGTYVISGVVLGSTTLGPPLHRAASAGVNGLVNAAVNFVQSL